MYASACDLFNIGTCTDCPAGSYQDQQYASVCSICPGGTFSLQKSSVCTSCTAGKYQTGSSLVTGCLDCHPGTTSDPGSQCCHGSIVTNTGCYDCPPGTYDDGNNQCASCPSTRSNPGRMYHTNSYKCPCAPGYTNTTATVCTQCAANTWKSSPTDSVLVNVTGYGACTAGKESGGLWDMEVYSDIWIYPKNYSFGFFDELQVYRSSCVECGGCPDTSFYLSFKRKSGDSWSYIVSIENPLKACIRIVYVSTSLLYTPPFQIVYQSTGKCVSCPVNTTSSPGSKSILDCQCNPGYSSYSSVCNTLVDVLSYRDVGTWQSDQLFYGECLQYRLIGGYKKWGVDSWISNRFYLPVHIRIQVRLSIVFIDAWTGETLQVFVDNKLVLQYRHFIQGSAELCGDSELLVPDTVKSLSFTVDHTSLTMDLKINVSKSTALGRSSRAWWGLTEFELLYSGTDCSPCSPGFYKSTVGLQACDSCPENSTSLPGATSISQCICPFGYTGLQGSVCSVCPAGKYKNVLGSSACEPCPLGSWSSTTGQSFCALCPIGKYLDYSLSTSTRGCQPCPFGTYSVQPGTVECISYLSDYLNSSSLNPSCGPKQYGTSKFGQDTTVTYSPLVMIQGSTSSIVFNHSHFFRVEDSASSVLYILDKERQAGWTVNRDINNNVLSYTNPKLIQMTKDSRYIFVFEKGSFVSMTSLQSYIKTVVIGTSSSTTSTDGIGSAASFSNAFAGDISYDSAFMVVLETGLNQIRKVDLSNFQVTTFTIAFTPICIAYAHKTDTVWAMNIYSVYLVNIPGLVAGVGSQAPVYQNVPGYFFSNVLGLMLSPTQDQILVAATDGRIQLVDVRSRQVQDFKRINGETFSKFIPDIKKRSIILASENLLVLSFYEITPDFCNECPSGHVSQPGSTSLIDCYTPQCSMDISVPIDGNYTSKQILEYDPYSPPVNVSTYAFERNCRCMAGYVGDGKTVCTPCPADTYSTGVDLTAGNISFCKACPNAKYAPAVSPSLVSCQTLFCVTEGYAFKTDNVIYYEPKKGYFLSCYCPSGYYGYPDNNVPCARCPAGTYSLNSTSSNACLSCPGNSTSAVGSFYCVCNKSYTPYQLPPASNPEGLPVVYTEYVRSETDRCTIVGSGAERYYSCDLACVYSRGSCNGTLQYSPSSQSLECVCVDGFLDVNGTCIYQQSPCPSTYNTTIVNETYVICSCPENTTTHSRNQSCTVGLTFLFSCPKGLLSPAGSNSVLQCTCIEGYVPVDDICTPCKEGTYQRGTSCLPCPSGLTSANASTSCACPLGKELIGSSCVGCSVGYYKPSLYQPCTLCPANTRTAAAGSYSLEQCFCNAGYAGSDGQACTICPRGKYKDFGPGPCNDCPANSDSMEGSITKFDCACAQGFSSNNDGSCSICRPGTYYDGTICRTCPTGSTSVQRSVSVDSCFCDRGYGGSGTACTACAVGKYKDAAKNAACTNCPDFASTIKQGSIDVSACFCLVGYRGTGSNQCEPCPAGEYKNITGSFQCTPCPVNSFMNQTASVAITDCKCVAGYYNAGGAGKVDCVQCPEDHYWSAGSCLRCFSNSVSAIGSVSVDACACKAGFYLSAPRTCSACPFNQFKAVSGNQNCTACPYPGVTSGTGSVSIAGCLCGPGFFSPNGSVPCYPCLPDHYSDVAGLLSCLSCSPNTVSREGSNSSADCVAAPGFFQSASPGSRRLLSTLSVSGYYIVQCPESTYSDVAGLFKCKNCPYRMVSGIGSSSVVNCYCPAGYYGAAGGICIPCDDGFFKSTAGTEYCTRCPFDMVTTDIASTSILNCTCARGYQLTPVSIPVTIDGIAFSQICQYCPVGKFKSAVGNHGCESCPAPYSTYFSGSTSFSDCVCGSGYYGVANGTCLPCPDYLLTTNRTLDACIQCPSNMEVVYASFLNRTCLCRKGYYPYQDGCAPCPFNTYKSERGAGSCQKCPVGSYSAMGSTKITDCQCGTGSYLLPDDGYCMPCYSASPLLCPAGLHSLEGATSLELCLCPVGYYKDVYGQCRQCRTELKACPQTMTTVGPAKSIFDCVCQINYYTVGLDAQTGLPICKKCPGNSVSNANSTFCQCAEGIFSQTINSCIYCGSGFQFDWNASVCYDVNECLAGQRCGLNSVCTNTYGSYECSCNANFYLNASGICDRCPSGMTSSIGSTSINQCFCPPGYGRLNSHTCFPCPANTYHSLASNDCISCPANSYSSTGRTNCTCDVGYLGFNYLELSSGVVTIDTDVCSISFIVNSEHVLPGQILNESCQIYFSSLLLGKNVIVAVSGSYPLVLHSVQAVVINATIDVSGRGGKGGSANLSSPIQPGSGRGGGPAATACWYGGAGGSYGGRGGDGFPALSAYGTLDIYSDWSASSVLGSGGGGGGTCDLPASASNDGGAGGGSLTISSFESILIGGSLLANGGDSSLYSSVDAIRLGN